MFHVKDACQEKVQENSVLESKLQERETTMNELKAKVGFRACNIFFQLENNEANDEALKQTMELELQTAQVGFFVSIVLLLYHSSFLRSFLDYQDECKAKTEETVALNDKLNEREKALMDLQAKVINSSDSIISFL